MMEVSKFRTDRAASLEAFREAWTYSRLSYRLEALERFGFRSADDISFAVENALRACGALGMDHRAHFKHLYKVDLFSGVVTSSWRTSKLGFYLVLCNGRTNNPSVAALQLEMLQGILPELE